MSQPIEDTERKATYQLKKSKCRPVGGEDTNLLHPQNEGHTSTGSEGKEKIV